MKPRILILALALAGCVPAAIEPSRDGGGPAAVPVKPPVEPGPLPANVTRVENPDGTTTVTIREPRCPNCSPWEY